MRGLRFVTIGLILICEAMAQSSSQPEAKLTADDYAIFNAVLKHAFQKGEFEQIVLLEHTSAGYPPGMAALTSSGIRDKELADLWAGMRERFSADNKIRLTLDPAQLSCPKRCTFVDSKTLDDIFGEKGPQWDGYYKRFPKSQGVSNISRPAYGAKGDVAIVYFATSSDMLAGTGNLYLLDKKPEGWSVRSVGQVWVS